MKIFKRQKYLSRIEPFIGRDIIKVLTGLRRVGKTTLLLQIKDYILQTYPDAEILHIDKEAYEYKDILTHEDLYRYVRAHTFGSGRRVVLIDEIQEITGFETALKHLLKESYDLYCTGSNARMFSSELATYLSGRYIEWHIRPLGYDEFLQARSLRDSDETLLQYIRYGGMPYLLQLALDDTLVYEYLRNILNTVILKDVIARHRIRDIDFLERLILYLAENTGQYVSAKKIADFIKSQRIRLSVNTVMNYLKYLTQAFLVDEVKRYDLKGKRIFEINEKYYFEDLGMRHTLLPYRPDDAGKVMENLVYNKLAMEGYEVQTGKWGDWEIDFVARKGEKTVYIQVAYLLESKETVRREFGNLLKIPDNHPKIVVSSSPFLSGNYEGILHMPIRKFLLEFE